MDDHTLACVLMLLTWAGGAGFWLRGLLKLRRLDREHRERVAEWDRRHRAEHERFLALMAELQFRIFPAPPMPDGPEEPTDTDTLRRLLASPTDGAALPARFTSEGGLAD